MSDSKELKRIAETLDRLLLIVASMAGRDGNSILLRNQETMRAQLHNIRHNIEGMDKDGRKRDLRGL